MKQNSYTGIGLGMIALMLVITSCSKDYLEKQPLDGPSATSFYSNENELMMGLAGCYRKLNFNGGGTGVESGGPWPLLLECASDLSWQRIVNHLQYVGIGSHDANNGFILGFWRNFYSGIAHCNFLLDNINKLDGKVAAAKLQQASAEARFIRAVMYHYLIELFGDVPLVTHMQTLEEAQVARTPKSEVVAFIIKELNEVLPDLPLNQDVINNGRATRGAALGYLARTALYNSQWGVAADAAKQVMNLNKYELEDRYDNLFKYAGQSNKEVMLSLQYLRGIVTHTTTRTQGIRLNGGVCTIVPFQNTVDGFDMIDGLPIDESPLYNAANPYANRDPRMEYTIAVPGNIVFGYLFQPHRDSLQTWNYNTNPATRVSNTDAINAFATFSGFMWRKYLDDDDKNFIRDSYLPIILMRYAEILLIYAEAKIESNDIDESVYNAINEVRQRSSVNMPPITTGKTQQQLREIVRKERRVEFANEGLRLFDIRRWRLAEKLMTGSFYGKPPKGLPSSAPQIDADGYIDYRQVSNVNEMRVIEVKQFNSTRDYLWPIPGIEVLTNSAMVQNPGF